MGTVTYAALMVIIFIIGALIFGYFETPVITLQKGLNSLDKGMKNLRNIKVLSLSKKNDKSLTVGLPQSVNTNKSEGSDDLKIYVHEY